MELSLLEQITALVEQYNEEFKFHGIKCTVHRRYFLSNVMSCRGNNLIDNVAYHFYEKKENAEFHNAPNRFKTVEISVKPLEKGILPKNDCKKYIFIIESIKRDRIGKEPKYLIHNEEKVLRKIEKRLKKLLKRARKESNSLWCKSNISDKIRYAVSVKYT